MSDYEIDRLWAEITAERLDLHELHAEIHRREQQFMRKAAALQFACQNKPSEQLQ